MHNSLTWQILPWWLLEPLKAQAISLVEAAEIWDLCLQHPGQWFQPPKHLHQAASRLQLWELPTHHTVH